MRTLEVGLVALSLLAVTCVGCADAEPGAARRARIEKPGKAAVETPVATEAGSTFGVNGKVVSDAAASVEILALGNDGALVPVGTAKVKDGAFNATVDADQSPTGIFIMKVTDVAGAIVGSGVVNGLPAFVQAFVIDATIDATTSFKAEILTTIAKKGVPGVQNYLNVVDAYVDAQLTNSIVLTGVFATDFNTLIGTVSDAVIAAENVIVDALQKAGLPIDISALQKAQSAAVSGVQGLVTSATGQLATNAKNLVAALQAATAGAAKPVDDLIFNAVVNGGAAFGSAFKKPGTQPAVAFAASKSVFTLESAMTSSSILESFSLGADSDKVIAAVTRATTAFMTTIQNAKSIGDLEAAKGALTDALLGKNGSDIVAQVTEAIRSSIEATFAPLVQGLASAVAKVDHDLIAAALASFDASAAELPAKLKADLSAPDAQKVAGALNLVRKQVVQ